MYASLNVRADNVAEAAVSTASPSFDLVRAADDEKVICGAAVQTMKPNTPPSSLNDQADKVLDEWRQHTVDWAPTAVLHSADDTKTPDDFTPLLLVRRNGVVFLESRGRLRARRYSTLVSRETEQRLRPMPTWRLSHRQSVYTVTDHLTQVP
ncbi:hypothetical protein PI124_g9618 [Phytophthora idaei]|nr:hypothetical protein PI124_g9618 [Phytophthora idaei]